MKSSWPGWLFLVGLGLGCLASPAPASASDINLAVNMYKKGNALFFEKKYKEALTKFLLAQKELPPEKRYDKARDNLSFFIGFCHYNLNNKKAAAPHFRQYLQSHHKTADKTEKVMEALKTMEGENQNQPPPSTPTNNGNPTPNNNKTPNSSGPSSSGENTSTNNGTPTNPNPRTNGNTPPRNGTGVGNPSNQGNINPPVRPPSKGSPHIVGWIVLGVGVAAIAGGAITGVIAQGNMANTEKTYQTLRSQGNLDAQSVSASFQAAQNQGWIANALYIGGGAIAGTGAVLLFVWKNPTR